MFQTKSGYAGTRAYAILYMRFINLFEIYKLGGSCFLYIYNANYKRLYSIDAIFLQVSSVVFMLLNVRIRLKNMNIWIISNCGCGFHIVAARIVSGVRPLFIYYYSCRCLFVTTVVRIFVCGNSPQQIVRNLSAHKPHPKLLYA